MCVRIMNFYRTILSENVSKRRVTLVRVWKRGSKSDEMTRNEMNAKQT